MRPVWSPHARTIGIGLAVVVLMLFGLASPAAAGEQVPFTSSGTTVVTGITRLPGGITQVDFSHSGTATYLGNYTGTGTNLLDQKGNFTYTGCLVGANGRDSVCYAFSGRLKRTYGECVVTATGGGTYMGQHDQCTGLIRFCWRILESKRRD